MTKRMLIDATHPEETRMVIVDDSRILDYDFITSAKKQIKGNIYLGKITRVEPSLQAAFVEYGGNRQGFLPFSEIHPDYYQIPVQDRKRLIEEQEAELQAEADAEEAEERAQEKRFSRRRGHRGRDNQQDEASQNPEDQSFSGLPGPVEEGLDIVGESQSQDENHGDLMFSDPFPQERTDDGDSNRDQLLENGQQAQTDISSEPDTLPAQPLESTDYVTQSDVIEPGAAVENAQGEAQAEAGKPLEVVNSEEVETLSGEDEYVTRPKKNFSRRYKIQEVIKRNQIVLVQVIKEERGNKGVSLSTYISLAGRYCVLMPNSSKAGGISRKISSADDRKRLKTISSELKVSKGMSAIIRTAGIDRTRAEIKRDYDYLVKLWNNIREQTLSSTAPALIYEEGDIVKRSIRDLYGSGLEEVLVQGDAAYRVAKDFMKMILPSHAARVKPYKGTLPLFYEYDIEDQLLLMHDPVVRLRSGAYIVLNPTEALIAIDVNSGRATGERNIEETAVKTNLEAVTEIARQIRLRDLAGLIVVDFIDMLDSRHRRQVEKAMKDALKSDRAKIQLSRISTFGLMEMSRQRLRPSVSEANMVTCPHCAGRGAIRSRDSVGIQIIRALEKEASTGQFTELRLIVNQTVGSYLFNSKRDTITALEKQYDIKVIMTIDETLLPGAFRLDKIKKPRDRGEGRERDEHGDSRRDRDRDKRWRDRSRDEQPAAELEDQPVEAGEESIAAAESEETRDEEGQPRRGRGRRRRGRGGKRDREDGQPRAPRRFDIPPAPDYPEPEYDGVHVVDMPEGQEAPLAAEGSEQSVEGQDQERRERGRGRRGGRGRGRRRWRERGDGKRTEGGFEDRPQEFSATDSADFSESKHEPAAREERPTGEEHYARKERPAREERPEPIQVRHFGPKNTDGVNGGETTAARGASLHATPDEHISSSPTGGSEKKSSRKGWWRRVVESE